MTIYLPYQNLTQSIDCLDNRRRIEQKKTIQKILTTLDYPNTKWSESYQATKWTNYKRVLLFLHDTSSIISIIKGSKTGLDLIFFTPEYFPKLTKKSIYNIFKQAKPIQYIQQVLEPQIIKEYPVWLSPKYCENQQEKLYTLGQADILISQIKKLPSYKKTFDWKTYYDIPIRISEISRQQILAIHKKHFPTLDLHTNNHYKQFSNAQHKYISKDLQNKSSSNIPPLLR
jgi:hypothetical protein